LAAQQQQLCGERQEVVQKIYDVFGEIVVYRSLEEDGAMIEITLNEKTGTWSVISTHTDGQSCTVDHGEAWRTVEPEPSEPEA